MIQIKVQVKVQVKIAGSVLLIFAGLLPARTLEVGPGKALTKPSQAAAMVQDGDTVSIAAGVYSGDACTWTASNLTLRAATPYAHLQADGAASQGKAIWVVQGKNTTIENIEFSGATVPDQNGAGIRQEGANLTVHHCYFHDNEDGILTGAGTSVILIEHSEFADNGFGDGYSHNMYIGNVTSFTLRYCYTHHAKVGHNIKSRAARNVIVCNRSFDGTDGTASYELDLPDGGSALIAGNVFQQGPATENPAILTFGEESVKNPAGPVQIINNTFVNDRPSGGTFINVPGSLAAGASVTVANNLFVGAGNWVNGKADTLGNVATLAPGFLDKAGFDYRLTAASPAVDKGKDPGQQDGVSLLPTQEFRPPDLVTTRVYVGAPDAGAFEYNAGSGVRGRRGEAPISAPNNGRDATRMAWTGFGFWFMGPALFPVDGLGRAAQ